MCVYTTRARLHIQTHTQTRAHTCMGANGTHAHTHTDTFEVPKDSKRVNKRASTLNVDLEEPGGFFLLAKTSCMICFKGTPTTGGSYMMR